METSKFFNLSQDEITEQQAFMEEIMFTNNIYVNGSLKKEFRYYRGELDAVLYYKDILEDDSVILNDLIAENPYLDDFGFVHTEALSTQYSIEYTLKYDRNKMLFAKSMALIKDGFCICFHPLNPITNELISKGCVEKYLFQLNDEGKEVLKFRASYNDDGSLFLLTLIANPEEPDPDDNLGFDEDNLSDLKNYTNLTDEEINYYKNSEFYPSNL